MTPTINRSRMSSIQNPNPVNLHIIEPSGGAAYFRLRKDEVQNPCFFPPIEPFDGATNFRRWKERVLLRLRTLRVAHVLSDPRPSSSDDAAAARAWDHDDSLCRGHIIDTLTDRLFDLHAHRPTARDLWDALQRAHGIEEEVALRFATDRFAEFRMADDEPVLDQVCHLQSIASDVASQGMKLSEKFLVGMIIAKLPPLWAEFKKPLLLERKELSMDELWSRLRGEEVTRRYEKERAGRNSESAVSVGKKSGKKGKGTCYNCGEPGHLARHCLQPLGHRGSLSSESNEGSVDFLQYA